VCGCSAAMRVTLLQSCIVVSNHSFAPCAAAQDLTMMREWINFQNDESVVRDRENLLHDTNSRVLTPGGADGAGAAASPSNPPPDASGTEPSPDSGPSRAEPAPRSIFASVNQSFNRRRDLSLAQYSKVQPGAFSETVADAGRGRGKRPPSSLSRAGSVFGGASRRPSMAGSQVTGDLPTCAALFPLHVSSVAARVSSVGSQMR
jgi:hypothetical protein